MCRLGQRIGMGKQRSGLAQAKIQRAEYPLALPHTHLCLRAMIWH